MLPLSERLRLLPLLRGSSSSTAWLVAASVAAWVTLLVVPAVAADGPPRRYVPLAQARLLHPSSSVVPAEEAGPDLHVEGYALRLQGMAGHLFESSRTVLIGSLTYDTMGLDYRFGEQASQTASLHALTGRLALMQLLDEGWGTLGFVQGGVGSDFAGVGWSDLRLTIGAAATYRVDGQWNLVFGGLYTNAFFGELVLPLLQVRYRDAPYRFDLLIPRGANAWYAPFSWLELGVEASVLAQRYGIYGTSGLGDEYGSLDVTVGPAARIYVFRGLFVSAEAGYDVRYVRVRQQGRLRHELLSLDGSFVALGTGYMY